MKKTILNLATALIAGGILVAGPAKAAEDVVIVYDASGSMWGQVEGTSKIEIAREVMADLVNGWDTDTSLGLVAYGHRAKGDCTDIETLISPGSVDKNAFINTVNAIKPLGKTPISASVQQAADLLSYRDRPATVVLISDGVETCNADPCALSAQLAKQGVKFTTHVVGFDLKDEAHASLSCIAENTGGVFVPASNAAELKNALDQVQSVMDLKPVKPEPEKVVEPEITLTGPEQVTTGAVFDFGWSGAINGRDFITIVPADADEGKAESYIRVKDDSEGKLTAPGTAGLYELRYVFEEGRRTLASISVEVVDAEVGLTGPEQVTTGAVFDFGWSGAINGRDFITIVPADADEGKAESYIRVKDDSEGKLTAPGTAGLYELRYVLEEGRRTLASVPIEVVDAEVGLAGPEQVTTGAVFDFGWSGAINGRDFITIVPADADEGKAESYIRVKDDSEGKLTAPGTAGLYELRYVLEEGRRTLASVPIEVVDAEVGLTGPEQVTTGAVFDFGWSGAINGRDFITIVPADADEGKAESYIRVKDDSEGKLTAPGTAGLYELRYVLEEGRRTLASISVEVVDAEVGLTGPEQVTTGAVFDFGWSGAINGRDFITIVPADADEGKAESYIRVKDDSEGKLTAPGTAGLYELRYVLEEGRRTLASISVEVVDAEVGLAGPAIVRAGNEVDVTWSGTINGRDFITIVPAGADEDTVKTYIRSGSRNEGRLKAPDEPGLYEIRYVLEEGRRTLASAPLEVVGADAPLDDGAGLQVPKTATPGQTITVTWTAGASDNSDQRIALARKEQPDFSWISAESVGAQKTMDMKMPDEPGTYEVRFLDVAGPKILGRSVVEVK